MELTPTLLHEVEFRPEWRGYNRAEVDDFLERVATSVEQLLARLRDAERGALAGGDESITRTLVLAQRTADAAIHEAEEQAARTVADARRHAEELVREAEDEARQAMDDTRHQLLEEVGALEDRRGALADDLSALEQHLAEQRAALQRVVDALQQVVDEPGLRPGERPEMRAPETAATADAGPAGHGSALIDEDVAPRAGAASRRMRPLRATPGGSPAVHDAAAAAALALDPDRRPAATVVRLGEEDVAGEETPEDLEETGDEPRYDRGADAGGGTVEDAPDGDADDGGPPTEAVRYISLDDEHDLARRAEEHDPFLAELRKAVTDDEPLGPREEEGESAQVAVFDQDYLDGREGFRARLRRRS